jgi:hypothetical protein
LGISASENQKSKMPLVNFTQFQSRLTSLDLGHLEVLKPLAIWNVTYYEWSSFGGENEANQLDLVWSVIFPKIARNWIDFARSKNVDCEDRSSKAYRIWLNALCDAQIAWATIHYKKTALVTLNTRDFQRNAESLKLLGLANIFEPKEALNFLKNSI